MELIKYELNIIYVLMVKEIKEADGWRIAEEGGLKVALNTKLNSSVNTANPIIKGNLNLTKNVTLDTINVMNRTGQIKSKIYYDEVDNRLIIQVTG